MIHSIRTGTGRTALKGALAAALLASTALVAPNDAFATAATQTAAGTTTVFQAPFLVTSTTPTFGYGLAARYSITMNGTPADQDGMELVAFLYSSDNSYIGMVRGGAAVGAAGATKTATVNLPSQAGGGNYTQVVFGLVYRGDEAGGANASDDTLDGVAANRSVLILRPGGTTRAGFTVASYDVGAGAAYTTAGGPTTAQLNAIGAQSGFNTSTNRVAISSSYIGPALQSAGKNAITPDRLRLIFNAALTDIADNTNVSACVQAQAGSTTNGTPTAQDGIGSGGTFNMAAGDNRFYVDNAGAAFGSAIDNVDILFGGCASVTDEAGNTAASSSNTTVTTFAAPAYATTNTGQLAIVQATNMDIRNLWSTAGVTPNNNTLTVDLRLAEGVTASTLNALDDLTITGLSTHTFNAGAASGNNARVTLNINPGNVGTHRIRFNRSNGRLQYSTDSGTTFTDVTIGLAVGATAVTSIEGTALGSALTAQNAVAGVIPTIAAANISTRDAVTNSATSTTTPDGRLDGLTVDFGAPIGTLGTGPQIFASATSTVLASTFTLDSSDSTKAHGLITNPTATADWDGNGTANESADNTLFNTTANFATDATGTTVRFRYAQLSTGTTRYAYAYNSSDGAQLGLTAIGTGLTVDTDGAGPVLQSATVRQNAADTANGRIELNFSEAMDVSGNQKSAFIATNTGNLALDMLNAGFTAITDAGTAGTTTSQVLVNGVPNSILANITSIGIAAANAQATQATGAFTDNSTNKIAASAVSVTPTNTALAVGPTILDNGATIVDNSQNVTGILLFLSKDATATVGAGATLAQRFNVDLTGAAACALDDIPVSTATVSGSVVTLTLQSPGISRRAIEGCDINVDYVNNSATYLADSSGNRLSNSGTDVTNGADDSNNTVVKPVYSANTWTQEIRGQITTDGTTTVPQGTLVRADLVRYRNQREIGSIVVNLPTGERDVMASATITAANFDEEDTLGNATSSSSFDADVVVTRTPSNPGAVQVAVETASGAQTAGANQIRYRVRIDRNSGSISGQVTGTVNLRSALTSLQSRDSARYAVTDAQGRYRVNVGTNFPGGSPFVLLSVKRPGQDWVLVTQADQSFSNHIPFAQDIALAAGSGPGAVNVAFNQAAGQNGTTTLNVDLSKIRTQGFASMASANQYQLVGLPGQWSRNASRLGDFRIHRFLTTINNTTGAPVALWTGDANLDEAFILSGNTARSAFELQRTNVDTMGTNFVPGLGLAWNDNTATRAAAERNLYYPISTTTVLPASLGAGWHLITYNGSSALTNIGNLGGSTVATQRVDMVIEVGGGNQARTWLRSQAADDGQRNTLTSLQPGQAYFVYLSAAVPAFTYQ